VKGKLFVFLLGFIIFSCSPIKVKEWSIADCDYSGNDVYIVPLKINFSRPMGYRQYEIEAELRLTKRYDTLYFKELSFEYNGKKWYLIKDLVKDLGRLQEVKAEVAVLSHRNVVKNAGNLSEVISEIEGPFFFPWDWEGLQQTFSHRKIFGNMKVGDGATLVMTQIYSFDNEPVQRQNFSVRVYCYTRSMEPPSFMYLP
jgi:hypothetical protein